MPALQNFASLVRFLLGYIKLLIPIAFALCILAFFWGTVRYIRAASDNPDDMKEKKNFLIYGIAALFVAFALWGLVALLSSIVGV